MRPYYKAKCVHGTGGSFIYVEPTWLQTPRGNDGGYPSDAEHTHVSTCFNMSIADARDLAKQLILAVVEAGGPEENPDQDKERR